MLNETATAERLWESYLTACEQVIQARDRVLKPLEERRNLAFLAWADEYRATHGDDKFLGVLELGEAQADWRTAEELAP